MTRITVAQARAHLSRYLARVAEGETFVICRGDEPVAELRPTTRQRKEPRPLGLAKGQVHLPDSFFDPLPDDLVSRFEGEGE